MATMVVSIIIYICIPSNPYVHNIIYIQTYVHVCECTCKVRILMCCRYNYGCECGMYIHTYVHTYMHTIQKYAHYLQCVIMEHPISVISISEVHSCMNCVERGKSTDSAGIDLYSKGSMSL